MIIKNIFQLQKNDLLYVNGDTSKFYIVLDVNYQRELLILKDNNNNIEVPFKCEMFKKIQPYEDEDEDVILDIQNIDLNKK